MATQASKRASRATVRAAVARCTLSIWKTKKKIGKIREKIYMRRLEEKRREEKVREEKMREEEGREEKMREERRKNVKRNRKEKMWCILINVVTCCATSHHVTSPHLSLLSNSSSGSNSDGRIRHTLECRRRVWSSGRLKVASIPYWLLCKGLCGGCGREWRHLALTYLQIIIHK